MKGEKLTPKQEAFVREYLVDLNATAAYLRAGYKASSESARRLASKLLTNIDIENAIKEAMEARSKRTEITLDWVLRELAKIAGFDPRKLFDADGSVKLVSQWDDETAAAVAYIDTAEIFAGVGDERSVVGLSKKVATRDKVRALELLGKHFGAFPNKTTLDVSEPLEALILASMRGKRE